MKPGKRYRLAVLFSLIVFITLNLTLILMALCAGVLLHLGLLNSPVRGAPLIVMGTVSAVLGTVFSHFAGRKPIEMLSQVSEATKEISKGNFDVHLDEQSKIEEIQTMAKNFNLMARELAGTEMLRNDFIENVSHEFKTPLASIEGYTTLLQQKGLSEEKRQEYISRILTSTRSLSSLTGNILLLSNLENQQIEIKKGKFSLDEQLRETILNQESAWTDKQLELDINLECVDIVACQELLYHVWQNLIGNAIKFTPEGGMIHVHLWQKENTAIVTVSDNGCGISAEALPRIFEKFYQADRSHHKAGNGLGLSLAKRIIDLHGGTIAVQSIPDQGTTFTVTLPLTG